MPRRPSRHEGADVDAHTKAPVALTVRKSLMVEDAKTMSRSVAEQARKLSNNLEEQVLEELENVPTSCELRGEWAISDEDLVELKKCTIKCSPTKRSTGSAHWSYLPPSQRVYFHAGRLLDIPTNFLTAVYINGALQVDPRKIARAYSQSWLCFDILVLVPDVMAIVEGAQDAAESTESIGLLRAARTGRLLPLVRFLRILRLGPVVQSE